VITALLKLIHDKNPEVRATVNYICTE